LGRCGDFAAAHLHISRAIALAPQSPQAHSVLASLLLHQHQWPEAIEAARAVVALTPGDPVAHLLLADVLLRCGDWREGWDELEWRLALFAGNPRGIAHALRWRGEEIKSSTLLVHAPDGAGDAIMFVRYLPALAARCAKLIFATDARLHSLLAQLPAQMANDTGPLPAFDRFADRLSLPRFFATTPQTVPFADGYLRADTQQTAIWAQSLPRGPKIGLVWATDARHPGHRQRSIPAAAMAPLIQSQDFHFVNLQVGTANSQGDLIGLRANPAATITDYAATVAIMENLALVITVDTAAAHLAGALNIPVWLLLAPMAEWRWQQDTDSSPWYRSMRLFRRLPDEPDWRGTIARVTASLANFMR